MRFYWSLQGSRSLPYIFVSIWCSQSGGNWNWTSRVQDWRRSSLAIHWIDHLAGLRTLMQVHGCQPRVVSRKTSIGGKIALEIVWFPGTWFSIYAYNIQFARLGLDWDFAAFLLIAWVETQFASRMGTRMHWYISGKIWKKTKTRNTTLLYPRISSFGDRRLPISLESGTGLLTCCWHPTSFMQDASLNHYGRQYALCYEKNNLLDLSWHITRDEK